MQSDLPIQGLHLPRFWTFFPHDFVSANFRLPDLISEVAVSLVTENWFLREFRVGCRVDFEMIPGGIDYAFEVW